MTSCCMDLQEMINQPARMGAKSILCFTSLVLFHISTKLHLSTAADSISPGQSLSGNRTIVSQGGVFELGFFTPGNSKNYYIGIWYKRIPKQTVVWVANRETPLPSTSSELKIGGDGNLVLINSSKTPIWSTNSTSVVKNSTLVVLLDTGNLVLRHGLNSSAVIWQSFDHPTDTWLPKGKVGSSKITGEVRRLTSWRSSEDPSPGPFSFELETNGTVQFLLLWNLTQQYWTSGAWNGGYFSLIPGSEQLSRRQNRYNFSYITNDNESYFTYILAERFVVRIVMDVSGQIHALTWGENVQEWMLYSSGPADQCDVHSVCGSFGICNSGTLPFCKCLRGFEPRSAKDWSLNDRSGGCVRKNQLYCDSNSSLSGEEDGFLRMPNVKFPANPVSMSVASANECELLCLNNCSCTAYAFSFDGRCSIWIGDLLNLQQQFDGGGRGVGDLYLRLAASELRSSTSSNGKIIGASVGSVIGMFAVLVIVFLLHRRGKRKRVSRASEQHHGHLIPFTYNDLKSATMKFSEKLGSGSFGSVFKGTLPDSTVIAVKKLERLCQGDKEFRNEVGTIGMIQHINLIRLHGFCSEGGKKLLVYDFMPNGSLDTVLFQENSVILDWKTRYQIALGIARGLSYLHEKCRDCIIHCDVKPENILLDAEFHPRVADFGMAKIIGHEFSKVLTTMRGTFGYLAPEWIYGVPITAKADVYSYGVMLFEIISGRRNARKDKDRNVGYFPLWAASKTTEGEVLSILDQRLQGIADMEQLSRACRVASWCMQSTESSRPSMGQVVQSLEGVLAVGVPPVPSHLHNLAENEETMVLDNESSVKEEEEYHKQRTQGFT